MGEENNFAYETQNNGVQNYADDNIDNNATESQEDAGVDISRPMENGEQPTMAVRVNPQTGRREIVYLEDEDNQTLQNQNNDIQYNQDTNNFAQTANAQQQVEAPAIEQPATVQEPSAPLFENLQQQSVQPYQNAGELIQAINNNSVDENRIPMELAFQYAAYKQQNQTASQQQAGELEADDRAEMEQRRYEFFDGVEKMAREAAIKDIGLTEEQIELAEYSDDPEIQEKAKRLPTIMAYHRNNILNQVAQKQAEERQAQQAQQTVYNNIRTSIENIRANEKEFDNINALMGSMYKTMPYEQAVKYASAIKAFNDGTITDAQSLDLKEYYDKARVAYYAKKNGYGTVQRPLPMTESPGNDVARQIMAQNEGMVTKQEIRNASTDYRTRQAVVQRWLANQEAKNR